MTERTETGDVQNTVGHPSPSFDPAQAGGAALAFLGDAVLEVQVRRYLVTSGITHAGRLSALTREYIRATAQSARLENLLPHLTGEEEAVYRRGRNAAGPHPKSATVAQYRRATGLEALFGYLHLTGRTERLEVLFALYMQDVWETGEEQSAQNRNNTVQDTDIGKETEETEAHADAEN